MANPEHVEIVRGGAKAIEGWQIACQRFPQLDLSDADLHELDLEGADLYDANMAGANLTSAVLENANLCIASLQGANLQYANLSGADLTQTNLINADLSLTNLTSAILHGARASFANFSGSDMSRADFSGARCSYADFAKSIFIETRFIDCNLTSANMKEVVLRDTIFAKCEMVTMRNLETVIHKGYSSVGIDTILLSRRWLPREFTRGCGVPDEIIEFLESQVDKPTRYHSCFLSHSCKDEAFVKHLKRSLEARGVNCFYFPETARTGRHLKQEINQAISHHDKLVVICSVNSLNSKPVIAEIEEGLRREQEEAVNNLTSQKELAPKDTVRTPQTAPPSPEPVIFPIMIDNYLLDNWQHHLQSVIKERVAADFREWNDPKVFSDQLDKLLRDLSY